MKEIKIRMKQTVRIFENDNFIVDYDDKKKKYRVSTFENNHYCDECEFDAYEGTKENN